MFVDAEAATGVLGNLSKDKNSRFAFFEREVRPNPVFVPLKRQFCSEPEQKIRGAEICAVMCQISVMALTCIIEGRLTVDAEVEQTADYANPAYDLVISVSITPRSNGHIVRYLSDAVR